MRIVFSQSDINGNAHTLSKVIVGNGLQYINAPLTISDELTTEGNLTQAFMGGNIYLQGNLIIKNTYHLSTTGTTTLHFTGTGNQIIDGQVGRAQGRLPHVVVNKPTGTLQLKGNVMVGRSWTHTQGTIDVNTHHSKVLFFNSNNTLTGNLVFDAVEFWATDGLAFSLNNNLPNNTLQVKDSLILSGTTALILNGNTLQAEGHIINTNTAYNGGGTATIQLTGTNNQTIAGLDSATTNAEGRGRLPRLSINKSGGLLTWRGVINVYGKLTWQQGFSEAPTYSKVVLFETDSLLGNTAAASLTPTTGNIVFYELKYMSNNTRKLQAPLTINRRLLLSGSLLKLNSQSINITTADSMAIEATARLLADDTTGNSTVNWRVGNSTRTYTVPFVNSSLQPVSLQADITQAGIGNSGSLTFSTYRTNTQNKPYPESNDNSYGFIDSNRLKIADRYWLLQHANFDSLPTLTVRTQYAAQDLASPNTINEDSLNLSTFTLPCWNKKTGTLNKAQKHYTATNIKQARVALALHDKSAVPVCNDGSTCSKAYLLKDYDYNNTVFNMTDTVMWFRFVAGDNSIVDFIIDYIDTSTTALSSIHLFSSCTNKIITNSSYNNKHINIFYFSAIPQNVYYIKVNKNNFLNKSFTIKRYFPRGSSCGLNDIELLPINSGDCFANDEKYPNNFFYANNTSIDSIPIKTINVNLVFIQRDTLFYSNSYGNFDENNPIHNLFFDKVEEKLNETFSNLWYVNADGTSLCFDGYAPDTRIRFNLNKYYIDDTTSNFEFAHQSGIVRPEVNWKYQPFCDFVDSISNPKGINVIFTNDSTELRKAFKNETNEPAILQVSMLPNFNFFDYDHAVHIPDEFIKFINNVNRANDNDTLFFDTTVTTLSNDYNVFKRSIDDLYKGLAHEIGHNLFGNFIQGSNACIPPTFGTGNHKNYCTNHIMNNNWNNNCTNGENNFRTHLTTDDILQAHKHLSTRDIRDYILDCPFNKNYEYIITGNDTIDTDFRWHGNIRINAGGSLYVSCTLRMPNESKIFVERGAKLIIDGGTITSGCNGMWQGIEVHGNSLLEQPALSAVLNNTYPSASNHHGVVILKNNATLENTRNAIALVKYNSNGSYALNYTGGIVYAENSTFKNNRRAVEFIKYKTSKSISTFKNCNFITTDWLNDPNTAFNAFVTIWDVQGIQFIRNTFENTNNTNYDLRGYGILSIDGGYETVNNLCANYQANGCGSYANTFKNLYYGIHARQTYPLLPYSLKINNNKFDNCYRGALVGADHPMILRNDFEVFDEAGGGYGLDLWGATNYKAEENTFNLSAPGIGAYAEGNIFPDRIYKNTFNHTDTYSWGIALGDFNRFLQLKCNTFNGQSDNILALARQSLAEQQGNCGFPGDPPSEQVKAPANNLFATTCNSNDLHVWVNSNTLDFTYSYNPSIARNEPICINNQNKVTKIDCGNLQSSGACGSSVVSPGNGGVSAGSLFETRKRKAHIIDSLHTHLDNNNHSNLLAYISNSSHTAKQVFDTLRHSGWLSDVMLLKALQRSPALSKVQKSRLIMKNSPSTREVKLLISSQALQGTIDSLYNAGVAKDTATARYDILMGMAQAEHEKHSAYMQLLFYTAIDSSVLLSKIIDTLKTETATLYKLQLADLYIAQQQYTQAENILNNLATDDAQLADYRNLRQITCTLFKNNKTWMDLGSEGYAYLDDIEAIAEGNGTASFIAKNILGLKNDTIYEEILLTKDQQRLGAFDEPVNETLQDNKTEPNKQEHDYRLKPNLFDGRLLANITLQANESGRVEIYNLHGVLVGKLLLVNGRNELDLSPMNLTNGVYLYRVWANEEIKYFDKLVKLK